MANINVGRRSGFIVRSGVRRRETLWTGFSWTENNIATSGAVFLGVLSAAELALRPFTVIRTRGMLLVNLDQTAASERQLGAFGACVVSDQASAIGVTAIPTPLTDQTSDLWFLYELFASQQNVATGVGIQGSVPQTFGSKAMRKIEDGQDLATVVELSSLSDGATFH